MKGFYVLAALLALSVLILAAACGDNSEGNGEPDETEGTPLSLNGDQELTPLPANSELVVGPNRFAIGFVDNETNEAILEGATVHLVFAFEGEQRAETDARFVWAIPDENGFFVADVDFDEAGQWEATATVTQEDGSEAEVKFSFPVSAEGFVPNVGEQAVASENLTIATEPNILRLSTDDDPEEALYQMTVTEALDAGRPLVLTFATPAFCATRFCGPVVDNVKTVWAEYGDRANFIHIEPFELDDEGGLATGEEGGPVPAQSTVDWNLQTEPWVFIIDADGTIVARFEGTVTADELSEALDALLA